MSDVIVVMQRRPDPAAGRPGRALRAAGQPLRRRLHRHLQLHRRDRRRASTATTRGHRRRTAACILPRPADRPGRGRRRATQVTRRDPPRAARGGARPDGATTAGPTAGRPSPGRIAPGDVPRGPDRVPDHDRSGGRARSSGARTHGRGSGPGPRSRASRSSSDGRRRRTWSSLAEARTDRRPRAAERHGGGGGTMAERDLDAIVRRMARPRVSRAGVPRGLGARRHRRRSSRPAAGRSAASRRRRRRRRVRRRVGGAGRSAAATYDDRGRPVHVQLGRVHRPGEHRGVQDALQHHGLVVRHLRPNEVLLTKLQGGGTGLYDIARPTAEYVTADGRRGLHRRADFRPDPERGRGSTRPSRTSSIRVRTRSTTSTTCPRTGARPASRSARKFVTEEIKTWQDFFEVAPKYSGKIVLVDSPGDVLTAPLKALGYSLNSVDPGELDQARELLMDLAPHVLALDSDDYGDQLATEEAVLGLVWTGGVVEPARRPGDRGHRVHRPRGRDPVLDGHLGACSPMRPHPEAGLAWLTSSTSRNPGRRRRTPTATPRRTTRPRSWSTRRSSTTRPCSSPDEVVRNPRGRENVSTDPLRATIWEDFSVEHRRLTTAGHRHPMTTATRRPPGDQPSRSARRGRCGPPARRRSLLAARVGLVPDPARRCRSRSWSCSASASGRRPAATAGGFTLENYSTILRSPEPFITSLMLAVLGTVLCLLVGLPLAYYIATRAGTPQGPVHHPARHPVLDELPDPDVRLAP